MKFKKGESVLWHGEPAIISDVITVNPITKKPVKHYVVRRTQNSIAGHLVAEEANTLEKLEAK